MSYEEETELTESELERIKNSHEQLLEFVEGCSKVAQKSWVFDLKETLRVARLQGRAEYMLQHVVEKNFLFDPHAYNTVSCDFQVKETRLAFDHDLMDLQQRVMELFEWYEDEKIRTQFLAPYLPVIQSSGMGKTKLLYELRHHLSASDRSIHVTLVLCSSGELDGDMKETYDEAVELEECMKREPDPELKYQEVELEMERICRLSGGKPTIVLFDEAQNLLVGKDNHLFNCIQWWLCKKQKRPQKVVAVFAGTTLQFANVSREPPESDDWGEYWMDGSKKYPAFYKFHTMGCLLSQIRINVKRHQAEYEESVGYGRPLFAKMGERGLLGEESQIDILRRLVLSHVNDWWRRIDSCFSVLATRVQMGQTTINISSQLVSRGYAILMDLDVEQQTADIAHLPDPVCARLAMCLMKESWRTNIGGLSGRNREFWVNKMAEIFSEQTCIPAAGDVGEVFAALYLLFCGDILRFMPQEQPTYDDEEEEELDMAKSNNQCKHFSVSLAKWIHLLMNGGAEPESWDEVTDTIDATICFIQVTQNYLRYQENMSCWTSQQFMEHLYKSRSAFYCFEDNAVFDVFASIRCQNDPDEPPEYFPLLVSIVCLPKFLPSEATSACCAMEMSLTKARCYGGLCILLVLGRTTKSEFDEDLLLKLEDLENIPNEIVAKVIEIPSHDSFNITNKFWGVTSEGTEKAEIYASHSYLSWYQPEELISKECLRAGKREETNGDDGALQYLDELRIAIGTGLGDSGEQRGSIFYFG